MITDKFTDLPIWDNDRFHADGESERESRNLRAVIVTAWG